MKHFNLRNVIVFSLLAGALLLPLSACDSEDATTDVAPQPAAAQVRGLGAAMRYAEIYDNLDPAFRDRFANAEDLSTLRGDLAGQSAAIDSLIDASRMTECDFQIDWSTGAMTLVPHFASLRQLAWMLREDAIRLAPDSPDAAADRLAALIRMGRHSATDNGAISKLIGYSITGLAFQPARDFVDQHRLTRDNRRMLVNELEAIDLHDPLAGSAAILHERQWTVHSLRINRNIEPSIAQGWALLDEATRNRYADEVDALLGQMQNLWSSPDAAAELNRVAQRASNPYIKTYVEPIALLRRQADRFANDLEDTIAKLKE